MGSHISKFIPPDVPMLPFVMLPRPLQESNVIGKAGTAGFLGKAYDPYYLYPPGDDTDQTKMDHIKLDDFTLRAEVSKSRLERRSSLRQLIDDGMPQLDKAVSSYALDAYYTKALSLILSGRARDAFDLTKETVATRDLYGRHYIRAVGASCTPGSFRQERASFRLTGHLWLTAIRKPQPGIHTRRTSIRSRTCTVRSSTARWRLFCRTCISGEFWRIRWWWLMSSSADHSDWA